MTLNDKQIIILVEADYQDLEVHYPRLRLIEAGAKVVIVGSGSAPRYTGKYGYPVDVDANIGDISPAKFDGIIIPGGWAPDKLRTSSDVLKIVRSLNNAGKTIGCICHGGWVLASADVVRNRNVTSYLAIRDDLVNAGAKWSDAEVIVDGNLITSRKPDDLPAFMREIINSLAG